jgi:hypothetical protein
VSTSIKTFHRLGAFERAAILKQENSDQIEERPEGRLQAESPAPQKNAPN